MSPLGEVSRIPNSYADGWARQHDCPGYVCPAYSCGVSKPCSRKEGIRVRPKMVTYKRAGCASFLRSLPSYRARIHMLSFLPHTLVQLESSPSVCDAPHCSSILRLQLPPLRVSIAGMSGLTESAIPVLGSPRGIPKPSSRVPSETSASWSEATDVTRRFVQYRESFRCWLCGNTEGCLLQVAHLVSKSEPSTVLFSYVCVSIEIADFVLVKFHRFKGCGWLGASVTHPAHPENSILLCVASHTRFDRDVPKWVFFPSDTILQTYTRFDRDVPKWVFFPSDTILQTYVDYEKEDYERRTQMASTGLSKPRTLPNILQLV
jgi:hypothetical protein